MREKKLILIALLILLSMQMTDGWTLSKDKQLFGPPGFVHSYYFVKTFTGEYDLNLGVYIQFCNDILQFVKSDSDSFQASYDLTITILDRHENVVGSTTMSDIIMVSTYPETNTRDLSNFVTEAFDLKAEKYELTVELTDAETGKTLRRKEELNFKNIDSEKLITSDIIFLDVLEYDSLEFSIIRPNILRTFNDSQLNFGAMVEIYPVSMRDSLEITYNVLDMDNKVLFTDVTNVIPKSKKISKQIPLKNVIEYAGKYELEIVVSQRKEEYRKKSKFTANWKYTNLNNLTYNQRLYEPLKSYVPDKELKRLNPESFVEMEKWYNTYWSDRDPTPDTQVNELQYEFYRRINFVNSHFSVNEIDKYSWETDRGRVYVKYGPPENVERHVNDLNRPPFEIWYYPDIDRRFIFEDRNGNGNYSLIKIE